MVKKLVKILAIVLLIFTAGQVYAFSISSQSFGGIVLKTKALKIEALERRGFTCNLQGGKTVQVRSFKGPTAYYIPANVRSRTNKEASVNRFILGKYTEKTPITCTHPDSDEEPQIENLDTIKVYGS